MPTRRSAPIAQLDLFAGPDPLGPVYREAATMAALLVLDASSKDILIVETVGVGQDEVDIASEADIAIVVLVPGLGDEVQALKAGIMEIADLFVVNKADRDGARIILTYFALDAAALI